MATEVPATLPDSLAKQTQEHILVTPAIPEVSATTSSLSIGLYNSTTSSTVYAYITGLALNNNNAVFLLESDGSTAYYPSNPSANGSALTANCAIALGAPGTTRTVTIPQLAGGRIYFCVGSTLTFLLNPSSTGAALVEPSMTNTSDPNYQLRWDFCEFTFNSTELYANISYVDLVCLPIALTLTNTSGTVTHVSGLPENGLTNVSNAMIAQNTSDGAGWDKCVISLNGSVLRVLSPQNAMTLNSGLFENYWTNYVNSCWAAYVSTPLIIDTQGQWGTVEGLTSNDRTTINFSGIGSFAKPDATDIFGANSGPFAGTNSAEMLNIGARIDAALNRSTLLTDSDQPDGETVSTFYTNSVTNHYARIVHAANLDKLGYAFPYDDVTATGGEDQNGSVEDANPQLLLVTVGGGNAYVKRDINVKRYVPPVRRMKRSLHLEEPISVREQERDLEKGDQKLLGEIRKPEGTRIPAFLERLFAPSILKIRASPFYARRLRPLIDLIQQFLISFLSLSLRALLSRVCIIVFFLLFYFLGVLPHEEKAGEGQKRIMEAITVGSANGSVLMAVQGS